MSSQNTQKILVIGPAWLGDMVMAQSLFKVLKQRMPEAIIDVVAPPWSAGVTERMPEVNAHYPLSIGHRRLEMGKRWRLAKTLGTKSYTQAIVLPRSLKSALIPFIAGIPRRTGFKGEMRYGLLNDIRPLDKTRLCQTVKCFSFLGLEQGTDNCPTIWPRLAVDTENAKTQMKTFRLDNNKFTVVIAPGAGSSFKEWPASHFAELVARVESAGAQALLIGSNKEQHLADTIIQQAEGMGINLCGKTSLPDVIDLIAQADVAVTNDSGLMHVAAATGTRLISIFGPSSPHFTPPLTDRASIHWLEMDCRPCRKAGGCKIGYPCLKNIAVDSIFDQLRIPQDRT